MDWLSTVAEKHSGWIMFLIFVVGYGLFETFQGWMAHRAEMEQKQLDLEIELTKKDQKR